MVEAVAVEGDSPGEPVQEATLATRAERCADADRSGAASSLAAMAHDAPVFDRTALLAGDRIAGPALIREANATTVVEPGWTAEITALDHMMLRRTVAAADARCCRTAAGRIRCCWSCSTTCS